MNSKRLLLISAAAVAVIIAAIALIMIITGAVGLVLVLAGLLAGRAKKAVSDN